MKKPAVARKTKKPIRQRFPRGWDEKRVKNVIAFYDRQTEEEELAEYEEGINREGRKLMLVPTELVGEIRRLIARWQRRG